MGKLFSPCSFCRVSISQLFILFVQPVWGIFYGNNYRYVSITFLNSSFCLHCCCLLLTSHQSGREETNVHLILCREIKESLCQLRLKDLCWNAGCKISKLFLQRKEWFAWDEIPKPVAEWSYPLRHQDFGFMYQILQPSFNQVHCCSLLYDIDKNIKSVEKLHSQKNELALVILYSDFS